MTFNDLKFEPHDVAKESIGSRFENRYKNAVQARVDFPNGYGASIIGGADGFYGDGVETFEVAVFAHGHLCYTTPITDDVLGWQSKEDVSRVLQEIESLPICGD